MPLSSDDSKTIDVGTENFVDFTRNPWGDLDVNEIPIEIVEDLHETGDSELTITLQEKSEEPRYLPLNEEDHRIVGLKFGLTFNKTDHNLTFVGIGNVLLKPPVVTVSARADGACFFHFIVKQGYLLINFVACTVQLHLKPYKVPIPKILHSTNLQKWTGVHCNYQYVQFLLLGH